MKKKCVVSVHGGLGNQLFQLGLAQKLSQVSVVHLSPWKDQIRTDDVGKAWIDRLKLSDNFERATDLLDLAYLSYSRLIFKIALLENRKRSTSSIFLMIRKFLTAFPQLFNVRVISVSVNGNFEIQNLLQRNYFVAYFQTEEAAKLLKVDLRKELQTVTSTEIISKAENNEILVLHIRRTDYKENKDIGLLPASYFSAALDLAAKQFYWNELWLFSDDTAEAISMVPSKFRDRLQVVSSDSDNPLEVMSQMIMGSSYILSNSTFGWWAAQMSVKQPQFVIVPKEWFAHMDEPIGLIPNSWIRV